MRAVFWSIAVLTATLPGCIVLPIPAKEETLVFGRSLAEADVRHITINATNLAAMKEQLGEPVLNFGPQRVFVYPWMVRKGSLWWAMGGGYLQGAGGTIPVTESHLFVVAFNRDGRVLKTGVVQLPRFSSVSEVVRNWLADNGLTFLVAGPRPNLPTQEGPRLFIYRPKDSSCQFPQSDMRILKPTVAVDGRIVGDLALGEYLPVGISAGEHDITIDPPPDYRMVTGVSALGDTDITGHPPKRIKEMVSTDQDLYIEVSACSGTGVIEIHATTRDSELAQSRMRGLQPAW